MENFKLTDNQLIEWGRKVSRVRAGFLYQAQEELAKVKEDTDKHRRHVQLVARKIERRGDYAASRAVWKSIPDFKEPVPVGSRKAVKRKKHLSLSDKIDIIHRVLVLYEE